MEVVILLGKPCKYSDQGQTTTKTHKIVYVHAPAGHSQQFASMVHTLPSFSFEKPCSCMKALASRRMARYFVEIPLWGGKRGALSPFNHTILKDVYLGTSICVNMGWVPPLTMIEHGIWYRLAFSFYQPSHTVTHMDFMIAINKGRISLSYHHPLMSVLLHIGYTSEGGFYV